MTSSLSKTQIVRLGLLAGGVGLLAGVAAAIMLWLMQRASALVWSVGESSWYILAVAMAGGVLIGVTRHLGATDSVDEQIAALRDPIHIHRRKALLVGFAAVIAVAFGGAVGPEAGLLAVVAELTAAIAIFLGRSHADARIIGEAGAAGALSGFYGSPLGGAAYADDTPEAPRALLLLAGLCGLLGFLVAARLLLSGGLHRIALPAYAAPGDGSDLLLSVVPALLGSAVGVAFLFALPAAKRLVQRLVPQAFWQPVLGGVAFGLVAAVLPILRFSGHHEIGAMLDWAAAAGMATLLLLGLLKVLAAVLCLSTGWLGGAIFPLIFSGAAAGASVLAVAPGIHPAVAIAAGMSGAATAGLGRPIAAILIMLFVVDGSLFGPICVGALCGYAGSLIAPKPTH